MLSSKRTGNTNKQLQFIWFKNLNIIDIFMRFDKSTTVQVTIFQNLPSLSKNWKMQLKVNLLQAKLQNVFLRRKFWVCPLFDSLFQNRVTMNDSTFNCYFISKINVECIQEHHVKWQESNKILIFCYIHVKTDKLLLSSCLGLSTRVKSVH